MVLIAKRNELRDLRTKMLQDTDVNDPSLAIEGKYRRISRIIILSIFTIYNCSTLVTFTIYPLLSEKDFMMSIYFQLPGTK